jgi:putative acetyltransferase
MPDLAYAKFSNLGALRFPRSSHGVQSGRRLPEGLTLRAVELGDIPGITKLANLPLYRAGTMRLPFQSEGETANWYAAGRDTASPTLVGEIGGEIVGVGGLQRQNGRRAHVAILGLGVHDAYQRRGVGAALLEALLDTAFNWLQIRRVELTVFSDNAAAIALYERYGFEREGVLRGCAFRDGVYVDVNAMALLSPWLAGKA